MLQPKLQSLSYPRFPSACLGVRVACASIESSALGEDTVRQARVSASRGGRLSRDAADQSRQVAEKEGSNVSGKATCGGVRVHVP